MSIETCWHYIFVENKNVNFKQYLLNVQDKKALICSCMYNLHENNMLNLMFIVVFFYLKTTVFAEISQFKEKLYFFSYVQNGCISPEIIRECLFCDLKGILIHWWKSWHTHFIFFWLRSCISLKLVYESVKKKTYVFKNYSILHIARYNTIWSKY